MKTLNISKLSLAVAFTLSTAPVLAQSSLLEDFEGRILSYAEFVDNERNQKMLMTFGEQSKAGSIAFNLDHTCGYVSGTLNLNDPANSDSREINIKLNKFGSTHACSAEDFNELRTLVTADDVFSLRLFTQETYFSSKTTGSNLRFSDVTKDAEEQRARQAILDSYWIKEYDPETDTNYKEPTSASVYEYLKGIQHPLDLSKFVGPESSVVHHQGLRIFSSDKTPTGIATETLVYSFKVSNETVGGKAGAGTKFFFDERTDRDAFDLTQGSIEFGHFFWASRIGLSWPGLLQSKNRFNVNGHSLTLSSDDASSRPFKYKRFIKSATIEDLKNTDWTGSIENEKVTAKFTSHSLDTMILNVESANSKALVKLSANKSGSLDKAEVVSASRGHAVTTTLNNTLPEAKLVVLDYSDANNRKLHIVTESKIFSLTEKGASTPITFN
ncbi:hypothetical protein HC752_12880 [Vibrio sp. S9_S30]|uniref:hypothetical protein n=1 Tax=Vibrio sp. S9_S30 TaxID=2720226 RepID=UPI00168086C2|nr:hypothetical protein [Vibrio sp. S9_S30]MBD1557828.1 hypothetical protein [Vibrio sp. S9_S30]